MKLSTYAKRLQRDGYGKMGCKVDNYIKIYFIEPLWSRKDFKAIAVENFKYVKHNKRGKFPQQNNTIHNTTNNSLLTFYISHFKSPWKTFQICPLASHNLHLTIYSLRLLQSQFSGINVH